MKDERIFPLAEYILICSGWGAMQGAMFGQAFGGVDLNWFYLAGVAMTVLGVVMFWPWTKWAQR